MFSFDAVGISNSRKATFDKLAAILNVLIQAFLGSMSNGFKGEGMNEISLNSVVFQFFNISVDYSNIEKKIYLILMNIQ